jgi:hypothetical protein
MHHLQGKRLNCTAKEPGTLAQGENKVHPHLAAEGEEHTPEIEL